jgi:CheY-like chemotaxis protein
MSKARVLVADDDESIRELLCLRLAREGYEVVGVRDGIAVLRAVQEARAAKPFQFAILDCAMPLMDGPTCAETIRKLEALKPQYCKLRIAFFSAYIDGIDCEELKQRGDADLCLEKGSGTTDSIDRLLNWLDGRG